ncbi:MAG: 3-methyl-2-oxobutanoate hydroxymethyltransferase [Xenococcaceae cyanobacterium]
MKQVSEYLLAKKLARQKIVSLTCYDYPTAILQERVGIDLLFVGDSVGTNVLGYADETEVTMDDIVHHLKAVRRGATKSHILADLPYASYETPAQALSNAQRLVAAGADIVKFEGANTEIVTYLIKHNIEVCGHLGLLPQTQQKKAFVGKDFAGAQQLIRDALALEKAGIKLLVLELVPEELGKIVSDRLKIPTIGIGAGKYTDGQVLIVNDILGITPRQLKLAKRYVDYQNLTVDAIARYKEEVEKISFPAEENLRHMAEDELEKLVEWLRLNSQE